MSEKACADLLHGNELWSQSMLKRDPDYFSRLQHVQQPRHLWIGCADSRVPANQIVNLEAGELFVHRNVANVVVPSDLNMLSVAQFAVEVLKVRHVIICGHYGCGGVKLALTGERVGLVDNWLSHIRDLRIRHTAELQLFTDDKTRWDRLCELNVIEQVMNFCQTTVARDAWERQQPLAIHGWVYGLHDGRLHDLLVTVHSRDEMRHVYEQAIARVFNSQSI